MFRKHRAAWISVVIALVIFASLGGGYVIAKSPLNPISADGVISAAYNKDSGELRLVNGKQDVLPSEQYIQWNQQGPTGPQGPMGPQGEQGIQGPPGNSSQSYSSDVIGSTQDDIYGTETYTFSIANESAMQIDIGTLSTGAFQVRIMMSKGTQPDDPAMSSINISLWDINNAKTYNFDISPASPICQISLPYNNNGSIVYPDLIFRLLSDSLVDMQYQYAGSNPPPLPVVYCSLPVGRAWFVNTPEVVINPDGKSAEVKVDFEGNPPGDYIVTVTWSGKPVNAQYAYLGIDQEADLTFTLESDGTFPKSGSCVVSILGPDGEIVSNPAQPYTVNW